MSINTVREKCQLPLPAATPGWGCLLRGCCSTPTLTCCCLAATAWLQQHPLAPICRGCSGCCPFRVNTSRRAGVVPEDTVLQRMNSHIGNSALEGQGSVPYSPPALTHAVLKALLGCNKSWSPRGGRVRDYLGMGGCN